MLNEVRGVNGIGGGKKGKLCRFHKAVVLREKAAWVEISYIWITRETVVIRLRGGGMVCLNCKYLNWWN